MSRADVGFVWMELDKLIISLDYGTSSGHFCIFQWTFYIPVAQQFLCLFLSAK
jgi:hypothetical protein